jgi:hypothetical protein
MIIRRSLTLLVLALALLAPTTASAENKPTRSVPKLLITLTDGAMNKGVITPTVNASFALPAGVTASKGCKGKIEFKAQTGTKKVKKHGKTVSVPTFVRKNGTVHVPAAPAAGCIASAALNLPDTLVGKKVKFTAGFKGNTAFKAATKTKSFAIVVLQGKVDKPAPLPVTPPKIYAGTWTAHLASGDPLPEWQFVIKSDGAVDGITQSGGYSPTCASGYDNPASVNLALSAPWSFVGETAAIEFHFTTGSGLNLQAINTDFTFSIDGTGSAGTGTFQASGTFMTHLTGGFNPETAHCEFPSAPLTLTKSP